MVTQSAALAHTRLPTLRESAFPGPEQELSPRRTRELWTTATLPGLDLCPSFNRPGGHIAGRAWCRSQWSLGRPGDQKVPQALDMKLASPLLPLTRSNPRLQNPTRPTHRSHDLRFRCASHRHSVAARPRTFYGPDIQHKETPWSSAGKSCLTGSTHRSHDLPFFFLRSFVFRVTGAWRLTNHRSSAGNSRLRDTSVTGSGASCLDDQENIWNPQWNAPTRKNA